MTHDRYGAYDEEIGVLAEVDAGLDVLNLTSDEEAIEAIRNADGILVNLFALTERVISSLDKCKVISRYGVGCA